MSTTTHKIMAIIDPTQSNQRALQHAIVTARRTANAVVYPYVCVNSELEAADAAELEAVELRRHELWLDELLASLDTEGVTISPIFQWAEDWRGAIVAAATEIGANIVIKRATVRPKSITNSDRQLIRNLPCAVLMLRSDVEAPLAKVLAAMKLDSNDEDHRLLDETVLQICDRIRARDAATELHIAYAYPNPEHFVDPPDIAKKVGVDRSQVHCVEGKPASVIGDVATKISADLVVMGNVGRRGLKGISIGNTAEKVLNELRCDLLIISRETETEDIEEMQSDVA